MEVATYRPDTWDIETRQGQRLATGLTPQEVQPWLDAHPAYRECAIEVNAPGRKLSIVETDPDGVIWEGITVNH